MVETSSGRLDINEARNETLVKVKESLEDAKRLWEALESRKADGEEIDPTVFARLRSAIATLEKMISSRPPRVPNGH